MPNPYSSALQVDPAREQQELIRLRSNPQKLAELGLNPDEDFSTLKNDPSKYNKVISYVKGQVYKSPAYAALESGQTRPEFATEQQGSEYAATPTAFRQQRAAPLAQTYNIDPLQQRADTLANGQYGALPNIQEKIRKEGGYDIEGMKDTFEQQRVGYADAYRKFVAGEMSGADYAAIVSQLSTSARSLDRAQTDFKSETDRAVGNYKSMAADAKSAHESAYKKYSDALDMEEKGYAESRTEKTKAAQEMYDSAKDILDKSKEEEAAYQKAMGRILNPKTGKYETIPKGGGDDKSEAAFRKEAADLVAKLDKQELGWGAAFDTLKIKYPYIDDAAINKILGGSVDYAEQVDPITKKTSKVYTNPQGRGGTVALIK